MNERSLETLLSQFVAKAKPGPFSYEHVYHHPGQGVHELSTVFGFLIHGNEFGTLPAALRLIDALESGELKAGGPVTLFLGNPEAARANERFLEEDFNRVFTFDRPASSHERRRADEVQPILDRADFFLDFHQTQTPTVRPFWTFPWRNEYGQIARALAVAEVGLTRADGQAFSPGLCCLDEYVRARGKIGLTVEVGFKGFDTLQAERTYRGASRLLALVDQLARGASLSELAAPEKPLTWFQTTHVVRAKTADFRLLPGYENWSEVRAGEIISAPHAPLIEAPGDGVVLFPKYPKDGEVPPPELMRIATEVADPSTLS